MATSATIVIANDPPPLVVGVLGEENLHAS